MNAQITTILQYEGIGWSPNFVTRTSDGILYAAKGGCGNMSLVDRPIAVYKSTDNGFTWIKDVAFIQSRSAANSSYRAAIAVDDNDKIHLAWGSRDGSYPNLHGYLSYATKPKGGSWSGVTDLTDYVGPTSGENAVYSMVIDGLNQVHILYLVRQAPVEPYYYFEHHWFDGSWHKETVYGGSAACRSMLAVDPDNAIYQLYDPEDHYAKKPLGGSWSTYEIPDFTPRRLCCDKDGNLHFCNGYQYRRRQSGGDWDALEEFASSDWQTGVQSISVSQDGVVHVIGQTSITFKYRHHQRSIAGDWSYEDIAAYGGYHTGSGSPLLHAIFPAYDSYYPCLLQSGYAVVYLVSWTWYGFAADPEIPPPPPTVTTYPATEITAVSATLNGTLDDDGGEACVCGFEWGETETYGNTTPTQSRTTGQTFSQDIIGLDPTKTYHFRAFATNAAGTGYGADRTFTTYSTGTGFGADRSFTTKSIVSKAYALAREEL